MLESPVHINTRVDRLSCLLHIAVLDRGPGVPEEELDLIFEPFFRSSRTRKNSNGYGLGLTIARRIIEAHNGQIRAGNRIDGGLCVDITLPCELLAGGARSRG